MMNRTYWLSWFIGVWFCVLLGACSGESDTPSQADSVATGVAATLTALAAKATPTSLPATATPVPPTATAIPQAPTPTPTKILIAVLPVDGEDGNKTLRSSDASREGRNVQLPGFAQDEVSIPLVFQGRINLRVEVFDPQVGTNDGDGIQQVRFDIQDNNGETVFQEDETRPAYCLFGGDDPACTLLTFAQAGYQWPNGNPIFNGDYTAVITIHPQYGDDATWRLGFRISGAKAPPTASEELVANLVQTGPHNTDLTLSDTLVFQVEAYDPAVGNADGDGIQKVDFWIDGPNGRTVYRRTENNAHYCAFSGGEPDCTLFDLRSNDHWPDGPEIQNGSYTLHWRAYAKDGREIEGSQEIEINR